MSVVWNNPLGRDHRCQHFDRPTVIENNDGHNDTESAIPVSVIGYHYPHLLPKTGSVSSGSASPGAPRTYLLPTGTEVGTGISTIIFDSNYNRV